MKKTFLISFLGIALLVSGCNNQSVPSENNQSDKIIQKENNDMQNDISSTEDNKITPEEFVVDKQITNNATDKSDEWRTYSNKKYAFSIKYPCNAKCQSSPPTSYKNYYIEDSMRLPFEYNKHTGVNLHTFSDESVKEHNENLQGPVFAFPYSIKKMRKELNKPIDQPCQIFDYFENNVTIPYVRKCEVVMLDNKKALKFIVDTEDRKSDLASKIRYVINIKENLWLEINKTYNPDDLNFLIDQTNITSELQKEISSAEEVISTLSFNE